MEASADEARLGGSMSSMRRQHRIALENDYTFLRTPAQVRDFVKKDRLEPLLGNEHLQVSKVSFPYARPEVKLFVERLAKQYHEATGVKLVVTSLTRPLSRQPRNAHKLSVHPAGMAVDFRVPPTAEARAWLESTLLSLEAKGLLDATRERKPPHYHIAVFPDKYRVYAERLIAREQLTANEADASREDVTQADNVAPASLEPSDASHSAHDGGDGGDGGDDGEPVTTMEASMLDGSSPMKAIFGMLGLSGLLLTGASMVRRNARRRGE